MNVILCLDQRNGMTFNGRRQSRDKNVFSDIKQLNCKKLYVTPFSEKLFSTTELNYVVCADMLNVAKAGEYCFVENLSLKDHVSTIDKFIIYRWDKKYPFDLSLDVSLEENGFSLQSVYEFSGNSHEKITREVYEK